MKTSNISELESPPNEAADSSVLSPQPQLSPNSINKQVEEFVRQVNGGIDAWIQAGTLLVSLRSQDPQIFRKIITIAPWLTADILVSFCRIGEGRMYPKALLMPHCAAYAEIISSPIATQERVCNQPIEVVQRFVGNAPVVTKMWARELDKKSVALVFKNGIVRTVEQQVAKLKAAKLKADTIVTAKLWSPPPIKPATEFPKMNSIPVATVMKSMGCYILGFDGDRPFLVKMDGTPLANTQTVICKLDSSNTLGALIEFKEWVVK